MNHEFLSAETQQGKKMITTVLTISIIINIFLSIATIGIGVFSGIQSIILDGVHTISDLFSDFLLMLIFPFAYKAKDHSHHYGHARYENILSLMIGLLIIISAQPFLYHSIKNVFSQNHIDIQTNIWSWIITITTIILKEFLCQITIKIGKKIQSPMLIANGIHHRSDVFSSFLVLIALLGIYLGFPILDDIISIFLGLYLCYAGLKIMIEAMHILSDRAPQNEVQLVKDILSKVEGVYNLHDLHLRQCGPFLFGDVHLEVDYRLTVVEAHDIITNAQKSLRSQLPQLRNFVIHIDPYYA